MKKIIIFTLLLFLFTGCNKIKSLLQDNKKSDSDKKEQVTTENQELPPDKPNSDNELRKKELELKEKELELKEKELDIEKNKNDSREDTRRNTSSNSNTRVERNNYGTTGSYPEGSLRYLSYNDIAGRSKWELSVMRNEIYARHGYIFTSNMSIKNHFESKSWYDPRYYNVDNMLSKVEKWNINYIKSFE